MKNFGIFVVFLFLLFSLSIGAITFTETYGGSEYEDAGAATQTADAGYIFVGSTQSYGAGYWDAWLVKTDANGTMEWHNSFGGVNAESAKSVQQTTDGGYILTGSTQSYGAGSHDIRLIRTDAFGDSIWTKTFGGTGYDVVSTVLQTTDGGFILSGQTSSFGAGSTDFWLIKTDENGILEWDETFGGGQADEAYSVQQTTDDGFIITGLTESFGAGDRDVWLVKTDENGTEEWNQTYGGTESDIAFSVQQTADGGYIIGGETQSYSVGEYDVWLIKTDETGNEQWNNTFGGTSEDKAFDVKQTNDGGYILAAWTWSFGAGIGDAWLIKTDAGGTQEWEQLYGGSNNDVARTVEQTSDGGYVIGGTTVSYGAGEGDFWLIKTNSTGGMAQDPEIEINTNEFAVEMMTDTTFSNSFTISNISSGTLDIAIEVEYTDGNNWLSINPNSGQLPPNITTTITNTFDSANLNAGNYECVIRIISNETELIIPVTLTILEQNAEIEINPIEFNLEMPINETLSDTLIISNIGNGTANFDIEISFQNNENWLLIETLSGAIPENETENIVLTFGSTDLIPADYQCEIAVICDDNQIIIPVILTIRETDIEENTINSVSKLFSNFPNPFNPVTTISFNLSLENSKNTKLEIFNLRGQKVRHFSILPNQNSIIWNGKDDNGNAVSSGVYFYKLSAGSFSQMKKMVLMKYFLFS